MALNILIVDDSPAMRAFVRRVLELSGLPVETWSGAGNGEEALAVAAAHSIDAVLTDINMPVMDGEEFVRRFRAQPAYSELPVIVVSTDATWQRIQNMLAIGANGYV